MSWKGKSGMGRFIEGFLRDEFDDLSEEELEILRAVTNYELYRSDDIKRVLSERAHEVLQRLRQEPPPTSTP
jgi:hypothetical protein